MLSFSRLLTPFGVLVGLAALSTPALAQTSHFNCYKSRSASVGAPFQTVDGVTLEDRIRTSTVRVKKPSQFCLPVDTNGEDPGAPADPEHLEDYRTATSERFSKVLNERVDDRFGTSFIDLRKPHSLMVPTAKSHDASPGPLTDPSVSHFQCYKVKRSKGQAKFQRVSGLTLEDQFGSMAVDVKKPSRLCLPVNKNDEDPGAPANAESLMCYKTRQSDRPKYAKRLGLYASNQFGNERVDAVKPAELCVPTDFACTPPDELCVSNSCGTKTSLGTIPDAENLVFTDTGRLFVSGGTNVFEITEDGNGGYDATAISPSDCNFTGLAQIGNTLYANCFDGNLYAATLNASPSLAPIHALGLTGANGLTAAGGKLYIVNGPTAGDPKIVRVTLDAGNPLAVTEQMVWFVGTLQFPNGIEFDGTDFYLTDSNLLGDPGSVRKLTINGDGTPGTLTTVWSATGILDDLSVGSDFILAAGFQNGDITLLDKSGNVVQNTLPASFSFPSAVRVGQGPLFASTDVLVTEKGVIGDTTGPVGNILSVFRAVCETP